MNLNRRKFFGLLPGAVVGGKAAAAQAATELAETMALGKPALSGAIGYANGAPYPGGNPANNIDWARNALKRLTSHERERRAREWSVTRLDPDLAVNRSMSLSAKILIQKDRDIERSFANERSYLEGVIAGFWS